MKLVSKGDLILVEFTAKIKETGEVLDTTNEEVAKEAGIFREDGIYEPMLVAIGERWVLEGLDDSLIGLEEGKNYTIEVPPERGAGPRDPSKVELLPLRYFKDVVPRPGMRLEIRGRLATIRAVGAGRVQVDFNPPLAGKTLVYDLTVKKILRTKREKIKALIHRRIPKIDVKGFRLKISKQMVEIEVPESAFSLEGLQLMKKGIASDLQKFLPIKEVKFVESYVKKEGKG